MSGLFRYNSNVTPNRRTSQNPFCSITQDGTMDSSFGFGFRSPSCSNLHTGTTAGNGALSPSHGLSLREFDEKLKALQKENFNLKFRVYFLETSLGGGNSGANGPNKAALDDDSLLKQNIDLKVEVEGLRKELEEKQELLVQAAKAMELMETSQRKQQETSSLTKADLEQKVHELEGEIRTWNSMQSVTSNKTLDNTAKITQFESELKTQIASLESVIKTNEEQIQNLIDNLNDAQQQLKNAADMIKNRDEQIKELKFRLPNNMSRDSIESFVSESDCTQNIEELKDQVLVQRQTLADKLCVIQELEEKLASKTRSHDKGCQTIQLLLIKTRELDAKIEELQSKKPSTSNQPESKEMDMLTAELQEARNDAEQAHRWRTECAEVCSILTARLNELAGFLDSLLKHKDVLSVLAQDRHKAMRKAVDNSLDLSRSLSITSAGRMSLNDTSLLQMSCISDVLKDSYFAGRFSFDETDTRNTLVIENLRSEVESLKSELSRLKSESNANGVDGRRERTVSRLPQVNEMHSDSEEWSEPDRQVSYERIGLDESIKLNAHVRSPPGKYKTAVSSSASDDTNDTRVMRKNSILRFQEKILELESQITCKHTEIDEIRTTNDDLHKAIERLNGEIETLMNKHQQQIEEMVEHEANILKSTTAQLTHQFTKDLDEKLAAQKELITRNYVLRTDFECVSHEKCELEERLADSETLLQLMRDNEDETKRQISEKDQIMRDLKRTADEATLTISKVVLERTKFMNERDHFEKLSREFKEKSDALAIETSELHSKLAKLSHDNAQLHNKLVLNETQFQLTRSASQGNARYVLSSPPKLNFTIGGVGGGGGGGGYNASSSGDQSGYTSDETRQRLENSSPDLGIDSDGTCRSSGTDGNVSRSFDTTKAHRSNKSELNDSFTNILMECEEENDNLELPRTPGNLSKLSPVVIQHDCEKIEKENAELRRKLERTRRAFEKTWAQLRISNQRKEQIEKDIRQEIYKTHSVLKNVRSNIDRAAASPLCKSASAATFKHE